MKSRFFLLTLFLCSLLILPGCWDYIEYEDMVQIITFGVDYNKDSNEITATIQYIPTSEKSIESSSVNNGVVYSATDRTLFGALSKLREGTFKDLFWGYLKVVVIGEEAAKYKMHDIIEHFNRTPVIRDSAYLVISQGKAEDTINTPDVNSVNSSGEEIYSLIDLSNDIGTAFPVAIHEFTAMLTVPGLEAVAPRVNTTNPELQKVKIEGAHRVSGVTAFKKDKFVGWLDEKETSGFSWITEKESRDYKVLLASEGENTEDQLYFQIDNSKSKIIAKFNEGNPIIDIEIKVSAELRKYYLNNGANLLLPTDINLMEKKLCDSIRSEIEAALIKSQRELQSDILGFGFAFYREDPKIWKTELESKWADIYPIMEVNIYVDATVQNTEKNLRKLIVK